MRSLIVILFVFCSTSISAQGESCDDTSCTGDTFVQFLRDTSGRDLKGTCLLPITSGSHTGEFYFGGTVGSSIYLSRITPEGIIRWEAEIPTPGESTQLFVLNRLQIDQSGAILGMGTVFNSPKIQRAFLFRYRPEGEAFDYFRLFSTNSEIVHLIEPPGSDDYQLIGNGLGGEAGIFETYLFQRVNKFTGAPVNTPRRFDIEGQEQISDVTSVDGQLYATGVATIGESGTSGTRAIFSRLNAQGDFAHFSTGHVGPDSESRLFGFDIEIIGGTVYILQWGSIGIVASGFGTQMILSAFDLAGELQWTREYDIQDYDGESGVELEPHDEGLLILGTALSGRRDLFLFAVDRDGEPRWNAAFRMEGNALLYWRANQQLYVDESGILAIATVSYPGTDRSEEVIMLRTGPNGELENECLERYVLNITHTVINTPWTEIQPTEIDIEGSWSSYNTAIGPLSLGRNNACQQPCCLPCPDPPTLPAVVVLCPEEESRLSPGEFDVYEWSPAELVDCTTCDTVTLISPPVGQQRRLSLRVSDASGDCVFVDSLLLVGRAEEGNFIESTVCGGQPYEWFDSLYFDPGLYLQANECGSVDTLSLNVLPAPEVTVSDLSICSGDTILIFGQNRSNSGVYRDTLPAANGCDSILEVRLLTYSRPLAVIEVDGDCDELTSQVNIDIEGGSSPYDIQWSNAETSGFSPLLTPGNYAFTLSDARGCGSEESIEVLPSQLPTFILPPDTTLGAGDSIRILPEISGELPPGSSWQWTPDSGLSCEDCPTPVARPGRSTEYTLSLTSPDGCMTMDEILISVEDRRRVYLPNAFTPNQDGINDRFFPFAGPEVEIVDQMRVYDRWGNLVFTAENFSPNQPSQGWDGRNRANQLNAGVFLYHLTLRLRNGEIITEAGSVTVLP